jgi:hypothetical protein
MCNMYTRPLCRASTYLHLAADVLCAILALIYFTRRCISVLNYMSSILAEQPSKATSGCSQCLFEFAANARAPSAPLFQFKAKLFYMQLIMAFSNSSSSLRAGLCNYISCHVLHLISACKKASFYGLQLHLRF